METPKFEQTLGVFYKVPPLNSYASLIITGFLFFVKIFFNFQNNPSGYARYFHGFAGF